MPRGVLGAKVSEVSANVKREGAVAMDASKNERTVEAWQLRCERLGAGEFAVDDAEWLERAILDSWTFFEWIDHCEAAKGGGALDRSNVDDDRLYARLIRWGPRRLLVETEDADRPALARRLARCLRDAEWLVRLDLELQGGEEFPDAWARTAAQVHGRLAVRFFDVALRCRRRVEVQPGVAASPLPVVEATVHDARVLVHVHVPKDWAAEAVDTRRWSAGLGPVAKEAKEASDSSSDDVFFRARPVGVDVRDEAITGAAWKRVVDEITVTVPSDGPTSLADGTIEFVFDSPERHVGADWIVCIVFDART